MLNKFFKMFVTLSVLGVVAFSVGCKDYDGAIDDLQEQINDLKNVKVPGLQTQIDALKSASVTAADLEAAIAKCQTACAADKAALEAKIAEVKAAVEGQATDLASTTDKLTAFMAAVGDLSSLGDQTLKEYIDSKVGEFLSSDELAAWKQAYDAFYADYTAFKAVANPTVEMINKFVGANTDFNEALKAALLAALEDDGWLKGAIIEKISGEYGNAIAALLKGRLTSVTLIPEKYLGGIETIDFKSFRYYEKTIKHDAKNETQTVEGVKDADGSLIYYTAGVDEISVRYHVSPRKITTADIEKPSFVYESAKNTRAKIEDELLVIKDYNVNDGELELTVSKATRELFPSSSYDTEIVTAALYVPIAEKNLAEDETEAGVYSDYARLTETTITPNIAALIDHNDSSKEEDGVYEDYYDETTRISYHHHFLPTYASAKVANPAYSILYDYKDFDLLDMVTGCATFTGGCYEMTKEDLAKYGFEFRFALAEEPNKKGNNNTDEQQFAQINGSVISSKLPNGVVNNKAAVGRRPVVRVELIDTTNDNKIVDVRYFSIEWTDKQLNDVKWNKEFDFTLRCSDFSGVITWDEIVNNILAKAADEGISYTEFTSYYNWRNATIKSEDHTVGTYAAYTNMMPPAPATGVEVEFNADTNSTALHTAALRWTLTEEQIGKVMDTAGNQTVFTKTIVITIPANYEPNGSIELTLTVNIKLPVLPVINGYNTTFWETLGDVARVYPVQYNTPVVLPDGTDAKAGDAGKDYETARYAFDFHRLFADNQVVKNLLPCGEWDIQFAHTQTAVGSADGIDYTYTGAISDPFLPLGSLSTMSREGYNLNALSNPAAVGGVATPSLNGAQAAFFEYASAMGTRWYAAENKPFEADGVTPAKAATHKSIPATIKLYVNDYENGIFVSDLDDVSHDHSVATSAGKSILSPITLSGSKVVFEAGKEKDFTVYVWAKINDYNPYLVHKFSVRFAAPLYLAPTSDLGSFTDQKITPSEVSYKNKAEIYDFAKYLVIGASGTAEEKKYTTQLQKYYETQQLEWTDDETKIMTNLKKDGNNYVADPNMKAEDATISVGEYFGHNAIQFDRANEKVTFQNVSGNRVESDVKLFFPVSLEHKWGVLTGWVSATVKPNTNNQ